MLYPLSYERVRTEIRSASLAHLEVLPKIADYQEIRCLRLSRELGLLGQDQLCQTPLVRARL